jgi:hypothetical protein
MVEEATIPETPATPKDLFYRVTNVRNSLCSGMLVVESWQQAKTWAAGKSEAELEVLAASSPESKVPLGYKLVVGEDLYGQSIYERVRR